MAAMVRAYVVNSIWVEQHTGAVIAERSFAMQHNELLVVNNSPFSNLENAKAYIGKEKKDWLLPVLETWLNHKKHIIETSAASTQVQKDNLKKCLDRMNEFQTQTIQAIAGRILKGQAVFVSLLPNSTNNSYQSSVNDLNEIIKFCTEETKPKT